MYYQNFITLSENVKRARIALLDAEKEEFLKRYTFPEKPSPDGFYHYNLKIARRKYKTFKAKRLDDLKEKVYQYEQRTSEMTLKSFQEVFEIVQEENLRYTKELEKKYSKENTVKRNKDAYKRFFQDTDFENRFVQNTSKKDIENIIILNLERYDLKKKAYQMMTGIIKSVFDYAFQEEWISENPYDRVNFKKFRNMIVSDTAIEKREHSTEDIEKIKSYIRTKQEKRPKFITPYALELQTLMGLRRGEVPPLRWSDVKEDHILISREMLTIRKDETYKKKTHVIVDHTKTWKDRKFPLTEGIKEFLERLKYVHELNGWETDYLFPAKNEYGVITTDTVYQFYFRMCKEIDISLSREYIKGPHSFRRNGITKVANANGGDIFLASQIYGNTPEVAKNNYFTGLNMEKTKAVLESIE